MEIQMEGKEVVCVCVCLWLFKIVECKKNNNNLRKNGLKKVNNYLHLQWRRLQSIVYVEQMLEILIPDDGIHSRQHRHQQYRPVFLFGGDRLHRLHYHLTISFGDQQ